MPPPQAAVHSESRRRLTLGCFRVRLPTETCSGWPRAGPGPPAVRTPLVLPTREDRILQQAHTSVAQTACPATDRKGSGSAGPPAPQTCSPQTCLVPLYLPHTVPARGRQQLTRNKHRTHVLKVRLTIAGIPPGPPNNKRNRDSGVAPTGPRPTGTAMAPGNKSSAGPPHSQMDAAGFNLSLPPPLGGTVPDPTTSIGRLWHCFARPAPNNNSGVTPPGPRTTATAMTPGNKSSAGPPHSLRGWPEPTHGSTYCGRRLSAALCTIRLSLRRWACLQCPCPESKAAALSLGSSHCASIVSHYHRQTTLRPESM